MHTPTEGEVRARLEEQKLIEPGAPIPRNLYRSTSQQLLAETQAARAAVLPDSVTTEPVLLSRFTYGTDAGLITVDVTLTPRKEPSNAQAL